MILNEYINTFTIRLNPGLAKKKKLRAWSSRTFCIKVRLIKIGEKNGYQHAEARWESCETSTMDCFANIVNSFLSLTIFAKHSILGFWIRLWHHCMGYYNVTIFTVNIICMTDSFAPLCLLFAFHIRFIKINTSI